MDDATYYAIQQSTPVTNNSGKRASQGRISINSQKLLSLKSQETQLVLRSPLKRPRFTTYKSHKYPDAKIYRALAACRPLKSLSKVVRKQVWKAATIEEYQPNQLINNGKLESDMDFLYVLRGSFVYKLDKNDTKTIERNYFVEFNRGEYIDAKTITARKLKPL